MEYLIYLLIAIVFYYYIKSRFRKKKESKINAGALAFSKILILGSKIDGKINDAEIGMVKDLVLTGDYAITWPSGTKIIAGTYDGSVANLIQVVKTAAGQYWLSISKEAT